MNAHVGWVDRLVLSLATRVERRVHQARATQAQRRALFGPHAVLHPNARISNPRGRDAVQIGPGTHIRGHLLTYGHGGRIKIGSNCYVGEETRVWSASEIRIGDRVLIAHGVDIHDNNSHPLAAEARARHFQGIASSGHPTVDPGIKCAPVVIENDVWIGLRSIILKGVHIGAGTIVAAGSLVTEDLPANVIAAGQPVRIIRQL